MNLSTVMLIILLEAIILSLAAVGVITWWLSRRSRQASGSTRPAPPAENDELSLPEDLHRQTRQYLKDELERTRSLRLGPGSQIPVAPEVLEVRMIALEAELKALDVANRPDAAWQTLAAELTPLAESLKASATTGAPEASEEQETADRQ